MARLFVLSTALAGALALASCGPRPANLVAPKTSAQPESTTIEALRGIDALAATASTVGFAYNQNRVSGITVSGTPVLGTAVGTGGIYLIGSRDGSDAQGRGVISIGGSGGYMKSDDPVNVPAPPFKFTCTPVGSDRLRIRAEVGPVPVNFATMSMPFDFGSQAVDRFSFNGSRYQLQCTGVDGWRTGSGANYSDIPQGCEIRDAQGTLLGRVGVASTQAPTSWGEVRGPLATFRVSVLNSSHYQKLLFINHFGTHNLELSFGSMRAGEKASVEIELVVTPATAPSWTYQAETAFAHQCWRADGDGWSANTRDDSQSFMLFGPGTRSIPAGNRTAVFRAQLDNRSADNFSVMACEVYDQTRNVILARREVRRSEFAGVFAYQDFTLPFSNPGGDALEFRVYYRRVSYLKVDRVVVK